MDSYNGEYNIQLESDSMGNDKNFSDNTISSLSSIITSEESSIRLVDYAIIYANITTDGQYMMAVNNNSRLNAKTHVFVIAMQDIIVNGIRLNSSQSTTYTAPFPNSLTITAINETKFIINLRQIDSLDDIEDSDRPQNVTLVYSFEDLIKFSIVGIPATFASLITCILAIVILKESNVQEGLYDEL